MTLWTGFRKQRSASDDTKLAHTKNKTKQVPTKILPKRKYNENAKTSKVQQCDSAVGLHLLQNNDCANNYIPTILFFARQEAYNVVRENLCLLFAHFTRIYPTKTALYLYTFLPIHSRSINQSARSTLQPISVGLFQHHPHQKYHDIFCSLISF